jgi:hypothetical protein
MCGAGAERQDRSEADQRAQGQHHQFSRSFADRAVSRSNRAGSGQTRRAKDMVFARTKTDSPHFFPTKIISQPRLFPTKTFSNEDMGSSDNVRLRLRRHHATWLLRVARRRAYPRTLVTAPCLFC